MNLYFLISGMKCNMSCGGWHAKYVTVCNVYQVSINGFKYIRGHLPQLTPWTSFPPIFCSHYFLLWQSATPVTSTQPVTRPIQWQVTDKTVAGEPNKRCSLCVLGHWLCLYITKALRGSDWGVGQCGGRWAGTRHRDQFIPSPSAKLGPMSVGLSVCIAARCFITHLCHGWICQVTTL